MAQDISKMETTQTAVEWLHYKWSNCKEWKWEEIEQWFEQAKAMEKEQIVDAFYEGMQANTFDPNNGRALIYYNETYNK